MNQATATKFIVVVRNCGVQFVTKGFGLGHKDDADEFDSVDQARKEIDARPKLASYHPEIESKEVA